MEHNSNNSSAKLPQITSPVQNEQIQSEININHKALTLIKKARKQVEDDAKMLANRIALLKQEEIKTMKKIEETRNKAIEIYHLKLKNEEKHLKRQKDKEKVQKSLHDSKLIKLKDKNKNQPNHSEEGPGEYVIQRQQRINMIKQEKEQYRKKKCLLQQQSLNHVLASKNRVKESKIQGKMKIQDFFNQKKEKFKNNYIHEMTEEENIKKRKENEILKMEKLEMDLISKLQSSQIMQKNAYEELQSALTLPAKEFEKRFLSEKNDNINENKEVKNENEQKQTEEVINTENTKEDNS